MKNGTQEIINSISGISLKEMNSVSLMKRTDTKFIIHESQLETILRKIKHNYQILEIDNKRIMSYKSLYFDTEDKKFYKDHHNGKINRTKIRMRKYVESDICFLEIKQKDSKGNTNKSRVSIDDFELNLSEKSKEFITTTTLAKYDLSPSIWNQFNRFTLTNIANKERVTFDINLSYEKNSKTKKYENLVIIELKHERYNRKSPIVKALKSLRIHPYSISKYCIGMISVYADLKYNVFKRKLLKINKLKA